MIRRMLFLLAIFAISSLGQPMEGRAQVDPPPRARQISFHTEYNGIPWKTESYSHPSSVRVTFAGLKTEPKYIVHLPDGSSFLLKSQYRVPNLNLSDTELAANADAMRVTVQNFAQVITSDQTIHFAYADGKSQTSAALRIDETRLGKIGYTQLDPLRGIFQFSNDGRFGNSLPANVSRIHFDIPDYLTDAGFKAPAPIEVKSSTIKSRLSRVLHFLLDSIVFSTGKAFRKNKSDRDQLRQSWDEIGIQLGIKTEALGGMGKLNLSASGAIYWYVGFNKRTYRFVYRRGLRQDKLSDGVGASLSAKAEGGLYRMDSDYAYKAEPREGYAAIKGETWYPPGLPAGSLSMDTGRGFQSDGIAVGPNAVDIGGAFLLNTVTSFEEVQRVYSFGLPDITDWLNSFIRQFDFKNPYPVDTRFNIDTRSALAVRCEGMFRSTVEIGF
ncbi:MAG: hypothetical protein U1E10_00045 [Bdellovibrionales bacterium]|nr:hypothetical protein [Bdellovibrionales bacterium]